MEEIAAVNYLKADHHYDLLMYIFFSLIFVYIFTKRESEGTSYMSWFWSH
jgi:hypothetical protein